MAPLILTTTGWPRCVRTHGHGPKCVPEFTSENHKRLSDLDKEIHSMENMLGALHREQHDLRRRQKNAAEMSMR